MNKKLNNKLQALLIEVIPAMQKTFGNRHIQVQIANMILQDLEQGIHATTKYLRSTINHFSLYKPNSVPSN